MPVKARAEVSTQAPSVTKIEFEGSDERIPFATALLMLVDGSIARLTMAELLP
jgi:hypothetical protein